MGTEVDSIPHHARILQGSHNAAYPCRSLQKLSNVLESIKNATAKCSRLRIGNPVHAGTWELHRSAQLHHLD